VLGEIGERLTAKLDEFGIVGGKIVRLIPDGFVFDISATPEHRQKLTAKILWLKRRRVRAAQDRRTHKRVPPGDARSALTLPDGTTINCMIMDVSRSGAAVSADVRARAGMSVTVGKIPGKVVRQLKVGFAVQFDQTQAPEALDALLSIHDALPAVPQPEPAEAA
jgi:hypothetical protein